MHSDKKGEEKEVILVYELRSFFTLIDQCVTDDLRQWKQIAAMCAKIKIFFGSTGERRIKRSL